MSLITEWTTLKSAFKAVCMRRSPLLIDQQSDNEALLKIKSGIKYCQTASLWALCALISGSTFDLRFCAFAHAVPLSQGETYS